MRFLRNKGNQLIDILTEISTKPGLQDSGQGEREHELQSGFRMHAILLGH